MGNRDERHGAICLSRVIPSGVDAAAQQAVEANMRHRPDADGEKINKSTTLKDVVGGATEVLPANKVTPREDADKVATAAAQNDQSRLEIQSRIVWMRFSFPRGKQSPMVGTKSVRE
uniref:SMP domain-containing protein n=5 Tax=Oryza TaxID=4527 RepID=Q2QSJ4_ORYSJ|nr:hypothetical protein LOC_Os12g23900 [Oryza sativa Japonica Group]